jgi:pilus assembly protein CpaE
MLNKLFSKNKEITAAVQPKSTRTASPIVAVLGAKGGVGATSIAVNLAVSIAIAGAKTTLFDCNLQQPDVAQLVGVEPEHSLMDLLHRMPFPDRQLYDACCTVVSNCGNNLNLLSPPLDGEAGLKTNLSQLADCLKTIRCYADFWVIDLARHLDKHLVNLTDVCDKILLVFEPTVTGVAACRRWLNTFVDLGYDRQRIICLLNRAGAKYGAVEKHIEDCFTGETVFRLPNASATIWDSSTRGVPVIVGHPKHAYTQAMFTLAQHLKQLAIPESETNLPTVNIPPTTMVPSN